MANVRKPAGTNLSRREALGLGIAIALGGASFARAATAPRRPNIVFILADDMGYADVSCYGRPDYRTPNIDAIAAQGVRFSQAYANSAVCSATRTALITGRYQYRLPVGLEEPIAGNARVVGLPPDQPTLPSLLRAAGYSTTLIGKWHLGELPAYGPLKSGYDHFYGFHGGVVDYFTHRGSGGQDDLWQDDVPVHQVGYLTTLLGDQAVAAIDRQAKSSQPFFLSLHFNAPHWPWEGPGDEAESRRLQPQKQLRDYDGGTQKTYAAMVTAMDEQVGRVLAALRRHGLADDTLVVFTSDNGGERFAMTWPFTGQKTELLEGGLRIPAIVSWPRVLPRGRVNDQVMISMDWMPTLLAAARATADAAPPSDGIDLMPVLAGGPTRRRMLFWRYKANRQRALRDGDMKYLKILDNEFLFNVAEDPLERANLKDRQPELFAQLKARWREWNATMLPERDETFTEGVTGAQEANHIGALAADGKADLDP